MTLAHICDMCGDRIRTNEFFQVTYGPSHVFVERKEFCTRICLANALNDDNFDWPSRDLIGPAEAEILSEARNRDRR